MKSEFIVALVILIMFLIWFYIDTHNKRWSERRIGSMASNLLMLDKNINPDVSQISGSNKTVYKNILAETVTINNEKTSATIVFNFIRQNNSSRLLSYTFDLKNANIEECVILSPNETNLCLTL